MKVVVSDSESTLSDARERIALAISTLAASDRRRSNQVLKRLKYVHVWNGHYTASTVDSGMLLSADDLRQAEVSELAGLLVHEMVHVRLRQYGLKSSPTRSRRIERRCLIEQCEALWTMGWTMIEPAQLVAAMLEDDWWTEAARGRDLLRLVREGKLPKFFARLIADREGLGELEKDD